MAYNPYIGASTQQNLLQALSAGKFGQQIGKAKKEERIGKDIEEFEAEIKRLEEAAKKKAEKDKGIFQGINLLGSLLGPAGSSILSGISGIAQGKQQQKAMEKLLNLSPKYAKTHLRKGYSDYMDKAKRMQIESKDIYEDALKSSLESYALSKAMYGGEQDPTKVAAGPKKGLLGRPGGFMSGQGKLAQKFGKPGDVGATPGVGDAPLPLDVEGFPIDVGTRDVPSKFIPESEFQPGRGGAFGVIKRGGGVGGGGVKHLMDTLTRPGAAIDDSGIMSLIALLGQGIE